MLGCAADGWGRSWDGGGIGGDPTGVRRDRGTTGTPRGSPGIAGNGGRCLWGLWGLRDMKGPDRNGTGPETGAGDSGEPGRAVGQQSCSPPVCPRCPPAVPLSVSFVTPRLCRVPRDAPGSGAGPSPVFAQGIGSGCGPGGSPGGPRLPTVLTSVPGGTGVPRDAVSPLQPGGGAGVWGGHRCPVCVTAGLGVFVGGDKTEPGASRSSQRRRWQRGHGEGSAVPALPAGLRSRPARHPRTGPGAPAQPEPARAQPGGDGAGEGLGEGGWGRGAGGPQHRFGQFWGLGGVPGELGRGNRDPSAGFGLLLSGPLSGDIPQHGGLGNFGVFSPSLLHPELCFSCREGGGTGGGTRGLTRQWEAPREQTLDPPIRARMGQGIRGDRSRTAGCPGKFGVMDPEILGVPGNSG